MRFIKINHNLLILKGTTLLIVICISRSRNHSLTYRENNCRRGRLRPRQDNLEDVKGFRGKGRQTVVPTIS
jgi:hypothetical protein